MSFLSSWIQRWLAVLAKCGVLRLRLEDDGEEQATAKNKRRRRTSNGEEQATAKNKQRRRTSNGEEQAMAKNKQWRKTGGVRSGR
jgi:hypothetical protein